jgi:fumarate reductase flavoprotein subunit
MKKLKVDVVVIGAGTAALPAAVTAAAGGASVVVFEKRGSTGGTGNRANAIGGVGSRIQQAQGEKLTPEQAYKIHMDWTRWRVDARLVSEFYRNAGSTIDWLEGQGVEFSGFQGERRSRGSDPYGHGEGHPLTAHVVKGLPPGPKQLGQAAAAMKILTKRAKELGVQFYLKTPARKILKRSGRVTGIIAEDEAGNEIRVETKVVIIATGGISGNKEMMKEYTGYEEGKDMFVLQKAGLVGDGIRLAWEAGAGASQIYMGLTHHLPPPCHGPGGASAEFAYFRLPYNIMVNLQGERFVNEDAGGAHAIVANTISIQKDRAAFMVFDGAMKKYYDEHDVGLPRATQGQWDQYRTFKHDNLDDNIREAQARGYKYLFMTDTLEELCQQTGIKLSGLLKTIEEYNHLCRAGHDDIFYKNPQYLMEFQKKPKFYAGRLFCGAYNSTGGIKINYKMEVLSRDFDVIPGLYAAGADANNMYTHSYTSLAGSHMGFAITSGRLAAEHALEYMKSIAK